MGRYRDSDAVEFLPDALAIRHEPLPYWARSGLLWMGIFFLLALLTIRFTLLPDIFRFQAQSFRFCTGFFHFLPLVLQLRKNILKILVALSN